MPDTTSKKRKANAEGSPPKKRKTVKKDKPEPEPEEEWRESVVPEDATVRTVQAILRLDSISICFMPLLVKITKTDALDLYRLKAEDLRGLHYVPDV